MSTLIDIRDLQVQFQTDDGIVRAVDGVNISIEKEKTLGVVGESGCGKSITALSIMGLIPQPAGQIVSGEIRFYRPDGMVDLAGLDPDGSRMRAIRGNEIAMIFQEPMTSLNPVYTIGDQIMEAIRLHQDLSKRAARQKAIDMLDAVGIPSPKQRIGEYPHQLSGGMRQRAMIAMALSCNPSLLIADEPTTALDVTIQAQVLDLMSQLQQEFKMAIMFITHDLGVIAHIANDIVIMYLGRIVESGPVEEIFYNPLHPYTQGLMKSIPSLTALGKKRLEPIQGVVPDALEIPQGCGFAPRCPNPHPHCFANMPPLLEIENDHWIACWQRNTNFTEV